MRGRFLLLLAAPAATLAQEIVPRGDSPTDVVPRHLSEVSYLGASECYDADAPSGNDPSPWHDSDGAIACCLLVKLGARRRQRPDLTRMESDALYLTHKSDAPVRNESGQAVYASKI